MDKIQLRKSYLEKRMALSSQEINNYNRRILENFQTFPLQKSSKILVYYPIETYHEVNTIPIIEYLWSRNMEVYLPKISGENMQAFLYTPETLLLTHQWKMKEPEGSKALEAQKLNMVILPLLACDWQGNRVGFGKGFYDRYLATCRSEVIKLGLSFFPPIEQKIPIDSWDIPLNYCVTPERIVSFLPNSIK